MKNQNALNNEVVVRIAEPQQWDTVDHIVQVAFYGDNPSMVLADMSQLACKADPKDVIRLVSMQGNDILATEAVQLKWNGDEVNSYLGAKFSVDFMPVFVMGRIAANFENKRPRAFSPLLHTSLTTMVEIAEKTNGVCALNVHAAGNPLINAFLKFGWQKIAIERTKGVFKGPQALTFLPDVKAIRHSLDLLNASQTVPNYRYEGASLADLLLTYKR